MPKISKYNIIYGMNISVYGCTYPIIWNFKQNNQLDYMILSNGLSRTYQSNIDLLQTNINIPYKILLKEDFTINQSLISLKNHNCFRLLMSLEAKLGIFDDYNEIDISNKKGFVLLKSKTKSPIEIKVSRLIMTIRSNIIEKFPLLFDYLPSSQEIEKFYNIFISSNYRVTIGMLSGIDILDGYIRNNYDIPNDSSSLARSCMTDKTQYLSIYTDNKNIRLAVVYNDKNKLIARCLLWKTDSGKYYYDRIYQNHDWASYYLVKQFNELGIMSIYGRYIEETVSLEKTKFLYYPYVDTFHYLNTKIKKLSTYPIRDRNIFAPKVNGKILSLRNQNGSYTKYIHFG